MRRKAHYVIEPRHPWSSISEMARTQHDELLITLEAGFRYIEIVETYKYRKETDRYSRNVPMEEIEENGFNLNISRYVSTAVEEVTIDLNKVSEDLMSINERIKTHADKHNEFLKELGLQPI